MSLVSDTTPHNHAGLEGNGVRHRVQLPVGVLIMAYGGPASLNEIPGYLAEAAACGGDVVGLDWHLPLDEAWERVGLERPVQGNLDPAALLAPWRELRFRIDDVLDRAWDRRGHVFNVGHGLVPQTPVDNVRRLVEHVRERTS